MRAIAVDAFRGPASLHEIPVPEIGPDDILVRVHAAGVNPIDWKIADGVKADAATGFPLVLGQDAAGTVDRVGANVSRFKVGDEVFGAFWFAGTYAEFVRGTPAANVAPKPRAVDFERAAALPTPARAALAAVDAAELNEGHKLLVVGATGGVGSYAVQIAVQRGVHVIATARRDAEPYIRELGAAETIDHRTADLVDEMLRRHPSGIDAVIDVVSGRDALERTALVLSSGGRVVTTIHAADVEGLAKRLIKATNIDVLGTTGGLDEVARLVDSGAITVPLTRVFPLDHAAEAIAESRSGRIRGKIVLKVA
ncbi:MAG: NADP-dependent oxidoreductase [Xanthobacteraceae bacterium]|nr:NADP-dependent oxidoreductase [Xanthobacteraceae bacterium]